jgi:3-oxoacyl-[acyl-carrier protein] reductase
MFPGSRRRLRSRDQRKEIHEDAMFDLTGKSALVTGATGPIGGAIARMLHAQGAAVAISGTRAEQAMGQLDVLVANAGVARDNLMVQLRDEDWDQVIAINLSATFRLSRAAVRGMMRRRFGRVVAITSVVGTTGNPGQANYVAAKAGITGMMKAIGQEYAKRGVTANCVAPGFIVTPMTEKLNDKQRDAILSRIPAGRAGTLNEVGAAVVYLASNEAAYVTGQTLHVNGGMAMI